MARNMGWATVAKAFTKSLFSNEPADQTASRLKWLMLARVVVTFLFLGSTLFLHFLTQTSVDHSAVYFRYLLIAFLFSLSLFYAVLSAKIKHHALFGYAQTAVDVCVVTLVILITGGFYSFFTFLYLVVIICASMILFLRGAVAIATLCSVQYFALTMLQYTDILPTIGLTEQLNALNEDGYHVLYKLLITTAACYAVAVLGGMLTEQNRDTQKELKSMGDHLKRVEKMAYMGEMAAGLAHEIKNPLASIVGSIQMLKDDFGYDPDQQRLMEIILRETDRLSTLVTNFLFFARPPAGKPAKFNLGSAIEEITNLFEKNSVHSAKLILKKELRPDLWVVMDPTHLRQIIWNLLLNSAESIEREGRIEIRTLLLKNGEISVQISDSGSGISPDVMHSIFDPFFTTKAEGNGLGLSIVHRILEAYDSRLDVNSEVGKGTVCSCAFRQVSPAVNS